MKKLLLLLFLVGCTHHPKFEVGDCLTRKTAESWEQEYLQKVVAVGNNHYLLCFVVNGCESGQTYTSDPFSIDDDWYKKVECP